METRYQKPVYDPFEVFKPTKTFLREVVKDLKRQCYELLEENRRDDFARMCNDQRLAKLNSRIRDYTFRLRADNKGHQRSDSIGQDHIFQAKQVPIQNFYTGQLRKAGKDLTGLCPFHSDTKPSFTIYRDGTRFKCFPCGAEGDTIDFIRRTKNLSFYQAVRFLITGYPPYETFINN